MTKKRQYKNELRNHLDDVNDMSGFPDTGIITLTFNIDTGDFTSVINASNEAKTLDDKDTGNNGQVFP